MKIVYFGSPQIAADVLDYLIDQGAQIVGVVTKPDKARGRSKKLLSPEVKALALERLTGVPIFQPEKTSDPDFIEALEALDADLFVVVAYGEIVKKKILNIPKLACVNLHASLLPLYRGASPIESCLVDGVSETGVTVMHMSVKMDAGDIIQMQSIPVDENMDAIQLIQEITQEGSACLWDCLKSLADGTAERRVQDHDQATYTKKIESSDLELDWTKSAWELHNLSRGMIAKGGTWAKILLNGNLKRLKVYKTRYREEIDQDSSSKAGAILKISPDSLTIQCGEGALDILSLQVEGKRRMDAADFLRGSPQVFFVGF